ncbi:MAG: hypothetical protein EHM59_17510 [Betaproteobacteria bacterium]|nr:MAG: hypothetical protein EHM59_17510 [Betaproteobacteria bacterium]
MLAFLDRSAARLLLAVVIAALALHVYGNRRIVAEDFALGAENFHGHEDWNGTRFTASSPKEIAALLRELPAASSTPRPATVLWLGNSQLHAVNQFKAGDHLAPYWLRKDWPCPDCLLPLGVSLPNASLQEFLVLYHAASTRVAIDAVIVAAVFDDLREDGLRPELDALLTEELRQRLQASEVGRGILERTAQASGATRSAENVGLEGFVQKTFEDRLTAGLGAVWPLWEKRPELRAHLLTDLYYLRNHALGIKATSVRPMIAPRLERNMRALEALLSDCRARGIPVVVYIAPIRHDLPLPYDAREYSAWKTRLQTLVHEHHARLLNLESLVPPQYWGTQQGDQIDFMHFQGSGHRLVAEALNPVLRRMLSGQR